VRDMWTLRYSGLYSILFSVMELIERASEYTFILASQSPRRRSIFNSLDLTHEVRVMDVDESYPESLSETEIATFIAQKKSVPHIPSLQKNEVLITADTIVWINDHILGKPKNLGHAKRMLAELSGSTHRVHTGFCIVVGGQTHSFNETTSVTFHPLSELEISRYVDKYSPLDKAGAYGIQEFIGYIGIKHIQGDFYNVVGFPVQRFWKELEGII
jgi:septum formation protein